MSACSYNSALFTPTPQLTPNSCHKGCYDILTLIDSFILSYKCAFIFNNRTKEDYTIHSMNPTPIPPLLEPEPLPEVSQNLQFQNYTSLWSLKDAVRLYSVSVDFKHYNYTIMSFDHFGPALQVGTHTFRVTELHFC